MKAIVSRRPGAPDTLRIEEIEKPFVTEDGILVRVHASSVNPADYFELTRPAHLIRSVSNRFTSRPVVLGADFSGTVEVVGKNVRQFQAGDEVLGGKARAFAEYLVVAESGPVVKKPARVSFEQAAALPIAAVTALQALRDHGRVEPGQKVLINGASGGVGTYAIQLAKCFGAKVTAVCSSRNYEQARGLGSDDVIDYTQEDFTRAGQSYDLILDIAGNRSWSDLRRTLRPNGRLVLIGGSSHTVKGQGKTIRHLVGLRLASMRDSRKVVFFIAKLTKPDLSFLGGLMERGQLRSVIDRQYVLNQVPDAMGYLAEGHARGKIVITVAGQSRVP